MKKTLLCIMVLLGLIAAATWYLPPQARFVPSVALIVIIIALIWSGEHKNPLF